MRKSRQDAWTKDEDLLLAEIVLRYIRNGKTQLEAFKQAASALSRSSAACGFRWNATIRQRHLQAIEVAKNNRKHHLTEQVNVDNDTEPDTIDSAITILEKVRNTKLHQRDIQGQRQEKQLLSLQEENKLLHQKIKRYEEAWVEMGRIWAWIDQSDPLDDIRKEH